MSEPTNAELKALMESLRVSFETDAKSRARWEAIKDERDERVLQQVLVLNQRVGALETDADGVKKQVTGAITDARKAMESFDHLQVFLHDTMKDTVKELVADESKKANEPLVALIKEQEVNRKAESLAAARLEAEKKTKQEEAALKAAQLAAKRDFILKAFTVATPILLTVLGILQYKLHADTETHLAQQDQRTVQVRQPVVLTPAPPGTEFYSSPRISDPWNQSPPLPAAASPSPSRAR